MTDRARKIKFIRDMRGRYGLEHAVDAAIREHGPSWLTDEQLEDLASTEVRRVRNYQHFQMSNRRRRAI